MTLTGNNPANDPDRKPVRSHSRFKPNRSLYHTPVFGLNTPHFAMEAVEGDRNVSLRSVSDVDTFNLKAPVMSPVKMFKDYFFAPLRAILPLNADKIITNPLTGEDVDASLVNSVVSFDDLLIHANTVAEHSSYYLDAAYEAESLEVADSYLLGLLVYLVRFAEPFFSDGCLLANLGCNLSNTLSFYRRDDGSYIHLDEFMEILCQRILTDIDNVSVTYTVQSSSDQYQVVMEDRYITVYPGMNDNRNGYNRVNLRRFLEDVRQGLSPYAIQVPNVELKADVDTTKRALLIDPEDPDSLPLPQSLFSGDTESKYLNFGRAIAYQLASAQFYTDDSVDYIYDTHTWHENMRSIAARALSAGSNALPSTFFYQNNGVTRQYDSVSGQVIHMILAGINVYPGPDQSGSTVRFFSGLTPSSYYFSAAYIINLLGFTRSLKFRDYFCGSKPHPLAVGDVNVDATAGSFSVVDVTKKIQVQRFLNQVNRVGRRLSEYVQGIFGVTPARDPREVTFLGSSMDIIGAEETDNTGSAQLTDPQTTTSKFRMNSSRFAFEGAFDEPGIVIGITRFDVVRPYLDGADRAFFHVDRFDMFNPYLQQIGDQEVFGSELDFRQADPFAYQLRYMEYRQSVDRAAGGFRNFLPGFAFLNDPSLYRSSISQDIQINPDFIRSRPSEFDRFYVSLTHYSLAGYFHFIIRVDNQVSLDRPMESAPSIL